MSALEIALTPSFIVFLILAAVAVASALLVVEHKSLVYSAFFLGVLGMSNAVIFALLGFSFIALFHLAVYIGAAVTFVLFAITMFEEVPPVERRVRFISLFAVLLTFVLIVGVFGTYFAGTVQPSYVDYKALAISLTDRYWFALIVAGLTLVTTLIEAITLARIERRE